MPTFSLFLFFEKKKKGKLICFNSWETGRDLLQIRHGFLLNLFQIRGNFFFKSKQTKPFRLQNVEDVGNLRTGNTGTQDSGLPSSVNLSSCGIRAQKTHSHTLFSRCKMELLRGLHWCSKSREKYLFIVWMFSKLGSGDFLVTVWWIGCYL